MAFTTLVLAQMFNVVNARSDERSAFVRPFANGWLWVAIGCSVVLQALVVHVPFLQRTFGTVALTGPDWLLCVGVASSVPWLKEASKLACQRVSSISGSGARRGPRAAWAARCPGAASSTRATSA
jgi:Ca2+-transporting ATPase